MAKQYCTILDVKKVARQFTSDYDRNDPETDADIELAIDEASDKARHLMQDRYDIATIDLSVPSILRNFTKIVSAIIMLSQLGPLTGADMDKQIDRLKTRAGYYKTTILNGRMLTTDGDKIDANALSESGETFGIDITITEAIDDLFEGGPRG